MRWNEMKLLTGLPSGPVKGTISVAADRIAVFGKLGLARSSWRNRRKLAVSFGLTISQPMPCCPGNSQLRKGK